MKTDKQSNKKKIILIISAAVLVIAAAVIIMAVCGLFGGGKPVDSKGVVGVISDNWDPGVEDSNPAQSGTKIPGYSTAEMKAGENTLSLSIGNPKENKVGMYASLKLSDGTVLYESPLLKPGQGVTEIPLSKSLEKGTYDAVVVYRCVMLDDDETPLNSAESGFKLIVD